MLSKINANMLIQCEKSIKNAQTKIVHDYKKKESSAELVNFPFSKNNDYVSLVNVDLTQFDNLGSLGPDGQPSDFKFTMAENSIMLQIEDIGEKLNKNRQAEI